MFNLMPGLTALGQSVGTKVVRYDADPSTAIDGAESEAFDDMFEEVAAEPPVSATPENIPEVDVVPDVSEPDAEEVGEAEHPDPLVDAVPAINAAGDQTSALETADLVPPKRMEPVMVRGLPDIVIPRPALANPPEQGGSKNAPQPSKPDPSRASDWQNLDVGRQPSSPLESGAIRIPVAVDRAVETRTAERAEQLTKEIMPQPRPQIADTAVAARDGATKPLMPRAGLIDRVPTPEATLVTGKVEWPPDMVVASDVPELIDLPRPDTAVRQMTEANVAQRAEMPRHVVFQIAEAVQRGGDKGIDLMLNPAELGRVKISLATADTGIVVSIVAERPETLDLLRRHIDVLAQDFHDIGYDSAEFAFGQNGAEPESGNGGNASSDSTFEGAPGGEPNRQVITGIVSDRVDIRL